MCDDQSHCHPWQELYPVERVPGGSADGVGLDQRSSQRSQRERQQREQATAGQGETEVHQTQVGVFDPQGRKISNFRFSLSPNLCFDLLENKQHW